MEKRKLAALLLALALGCGFFFLPTLQTPGAAEEKTEEMEEFEEVAGAPDEETPGSVDEEKEASEGEETPPSEGEEEGPAQEEELPVVDETAPVITLSFDNNDPRNACYFTAPRVATIEITEQSDHFNEEAATAGIVITAQNATGEEVEDAYTISDWVTTPGEEAIDDVHTATITFAVDANYTLSIAYTDEAGNEAEGVETDAEAPFAFTVDTTAPFGTITVSVGDISRSWDELLSDICVSVFSNEAMEIVADWGDATSPMESVKYYKSTADEALTTEALEALAEDVWESYAQLTTAANERLTLYLRLTDFAGNVTYISSDGLLVDAKAPQISLSATAAEGAQPENDCYCTDVCVSVAVTDPAINEAFAGLSLITYRVYADGSLTQSGTLFSDTTEHPAFSALQQSYTDEILVDASLNNSSDVQVLLFAEDKAGNASSATLSFSINTTPPAVDISIDGTEDEEALSGYYNAPRTATITITDRSDSFDREAATAGILIAMTDAAGATLLDAECHISSWESQGNVHTATVSFAADAAYTWSFSYTNRAGLSCSAGAEGGENEAVQGENVFSFVVDTRESSITLTPSAAAADNGNTYSYGYYNGDVTVTVSVCDDAAGDGAYAGISSVSYWIVCDGETTKAETLLAQALPAGIRLWSDALTVPAKENNSCDVVVYVKTMDCAGNESVAEVALDIDVTAPTISVYSDSISSPYDSYYPAARTATLTITERTHHFDAAAATAGISITAVDAKGNVVSNAYTISSWSTIEGASADEATHTATVIFAEDANYTFALSYTDRATNQAGEANLCAALAPASFTVDTTAPTGTLTATTGELERSWEALIENVTFGIFSQNEVTFAVSREDVTSPIESVSYYASSSPKALAREALEALLESAWTEMDSLTITGEKQLLLYVRIVDMAGNATLISSDGIIIDATAPEGEATPAITLSPAQPVNGYYKKDVEVSITVTDPTSGDTFAGLKEVRYEVMSLGQLTQSGTLFSFTETAPAYEALQQIYTGSVVIDAEKNNSNTVVLTVYATDNAGNSSSQTLDLSIDTTAPTIRISYDNNSPGSGGCYGKKRTATIVITERNFSAEDVTITITNTDGTLPKISGWKTVISGKNGDATTHKATITYTADGDYTFAIAYTDEAGNKCKDISYADGTKDATAFTIDGTRPIVSVSFDNNTATNGRYFAAARTATVTVTEHNFDAERVVFTMTGSLSGSAVSLPTVSWRHSGDVHTATLFFRSDGDYTFDVTVSDLADNKEASVDYATSVAARDFTIDTAIDVPQITGAQNGASYTEALLLGISFSDVNLASCDVTLHRTRRNEINEDVTAAFLPTLQLGATSGGGTFDTFDELQENDGIYTLVVKVKDLAGNEASASVTFTLNRFGSVYVFGEEILSLQDSYVRQVTEALVVTEYNPNPLVEGSLQIELIKDGAPLSDVSYTVSPAINTFAAVGSSGWYEYTYVIDAENFAQDGIYRLSISSQDTAGNAPESTGSEEGQILFFVDATAAEITAVAGLEEPIVDADALTVSFSVFDAMGLAQVVVYVDDEEVGSWEGEALEGSLSHTASVQVAAANYARQLRFVITDLAGNVLDTDDTDAEGGALFQPGFPFYRSVTVSTSFLVRWYANKPLFYGTIVAGCLLATMTGGCLLLRRRRRRKAL